MGLEDDIRKITADSRIQEAAAQQTAQDHAANVRQFIDELAGLINRAAENLGPTQLSVARIIRKRESKRHKTPFRQAKFEWMTVWEGQGWLIARGEQDVGRGIEEYTIYQHLALLGDKRLAFCRQWLSEDWYELVGEPIDRSKARETISGFLRDWTDVGLGAWHLDQYKKSVAQLMAHGRLLS